MVQDVGGIVAMGHTLSSSLVTTISFGGKSAKARIAR